MYWGFLAAVFVVSFVVGAVARTGSSKSPRERR